MWVFCCYHAICFGTIDGWDEMSLSKFQKFGMFNVYQNAEIKLLHNKPYLSECQHYANYCWVTSGKFA